MNRKYGIILLVTAIAFLSSCMTVGSDMEPDWLSEVRVDPLGSVYVVNNGERVMVGTEKDLFLLDGNSGSIVMALEESAWEQQLRNIRIDRVFSGDFVSWQYDIVPLEHSNVILLFDFRFATEAVTGLDGTTGQTLWATTDFDYSLGKYMGLIEAGAANVGSRIARLFGADFQQESEEEKRERQVQFMERVVRESPNGDLIFFKTFDGLVIMNPLTGEVINQVEFYGAGLAEVQQLDNGDYLVLSGASSLSELALASQHSLARISPNGTLIWRANHSGTNTENLVVAGNVVIVNGGPTEAFDLATGRPLWSNDEVTNATAFHTILVDGNDVFMASDLVSQEYIVANSKIWKQNLQTGEILWTTDRIRTEYHGLIRSDDVLVVWGFGNFFSNNRGGVVAFNASTGDELWRTGPLNTGGISPTSLRTVAGVIEVESNLAFADTRQVFLVDIRTGDPVVVKDYDRGLLRNILGMERVGDRFVLIGTRGVIAYDLALNQELFVIETENSFSYEISGTDLILRRQDQRAQVVNLTNGTASPVVRVNRGNRIFGDVDGQVVVTSADPRFFTVDSRGTIMRFSF
jgi:outer membrane protein assembly factor BamB